MLIFDKKVGDIIKIKEGSTLTDFIIVHKGKPSNAYDNSCDGIWVMRKSYSAYKAWNSENVSCDYKDCLISTYLNGDYYNSFEQHVKDCIVTVKIPHYTNGSVKTGANGLETKVFLLSHSEMGLTYDDTAVVPIIGSPLEFYSGNYKNNFSSLSYNYGIRSVKKVDNETFFGYVTGNILNFNTSHTASDYVTPAFILSPGAFVKGDGTFIGSIISPAT